MDGPKTASLLNFHPVERPRATQVHIEQPATAVFGLPAAASGSGRSSRAIYRVTLLVVEQLLSHVPWLWSPNVMSNVHCTPYVDHLFMWISWMFCDICSTGFFGFVGRTTAANQPRHVVQSGTENQNETSLNPTERVYNVKSVHSIWSLASLNVPPSLGLVPGREGEADSQNPLSRLNERTLNKLWICYCDTFLPWNCYIC